MNTELTYIISNVIISLYGVLVKKYHQHVNIFEQVYLRSLAFVIISVLALNRNFNYKLLLSKDSIGLSIINLLSIYGMYLAYYYLGIGISNSLFYTWAVFLYVIAVPILNSSFAINELIILIVTFIASTFILSDKLYDHINNNHINNTLIGTAGVIVAIITHIITIIYFKKNSDDIHTYLFKLYGVGLIFMIIYKTYLSKYIDKENSIESSLFKFEKHHIMVFLFTLIFGYLGFYLNFFGVGKLSPFKISILTFLSICISFLIGFVFFKEKTNPLQWVGILLIVILNYKTVYPI